MSKTVQLSERAVELAQKKVDQGLYSDLQAAFDEAARLLDEVDYDRELDEMLQITIGQYERGEAVPFTRELNHQIFQEALKLHRLGVKPE